MKDVQLQAYGEHGILVRGLGETEWRQLVDRLESALPLGCSEYIAGYDSVLLLYAGAVASARELRGWLDAIDGTAVMAGGERPVRSIPVVYDGPDLEAVARQTALSVEEVIRRHSAPVYTVRMMGFTPGFPYLDGLDPVLHVPRRDSPRSRIEPGSVAIGGGHAGIYSVASPGGWQLLGRTDVRLFDAGAAQADPLRAEAIFLLAPGDRLRFQPAVVCA